MAHNMMTLQKRILYLQSYYGGLRGAARATGIDVAYLKRLRDGEKTNPGSDVLDKLGLKQEFIYVLK